MPRNQRHIRSKRKIFATIETSEHKEHVDRAALHYLLSVTKEKLIEDGNEWVIVFDCPIYSTPFEKMKHVCRQLYRKLHVSNIVKKYRHVLDGMPFGFEFTKTVSFETMPQPLMEALASERYVQFKMRAFLPALVLDLLKDRHNQFPELRSYVDDPERLQQEIRTSYSVRQEDAEMYFNRCVLAPNHSPDWKRTGVLDELMERLDAFADEVVRARKKLLEREERLRKDFWKARAAYPDREESVFSAFLLTKLHDVQGKVFRIDSCRMMGSALVDKTRSGSGERDLQFTLQNLRRLRLPLKVPPPREFFNDPRQSHVPINWDLICQTVVLCPEMDKFGRQVPFCKLVEEAETCIAERLNEHYALLKSMGLPCEKRVLEGRRNVLKYVCIKPNMQHAKVIFVVNDDNCVREERNAFEIWQQSRHRLEFDTKIFNPHPIGHPKAATRSQLNTWVGLGIPHELARKYVLERDVLDPILGHIRDIIAQGDENAYEYILNWFAAKYQKPWRRMQTVLAVTGEEGSGKGTVFEFLAALFRVFDKDDPRQDDLSQAERPYKHVTNIEHLIGHFNEQLEGALLVFVDENSWGGDAKKAGTLRALITEDSHQLNKKYGNLVTQRTFGDIVMASNYDWVMQQSPTERRCFYLQCSNKYAGIQNSMSKAYFDKIHAVPKVAFAKFLLERDVTDFNPKAIPVTKFAQIQVEHSLPAELQFWNEALKTGEMRLHEPDLVSGFNPGEGCGTREQVVEFAGKRIIKRHVHDAFVRWFKGRKVRGNPVAETEFWVKLKKVCDFTPCRPRYGNSQRARSVHFPPLEQCRERFCEVIGHGQWTFDGEYSVKRRRLV